MPIKIYSVSELTKLIKEILEGNFYSIWVEGEVSTLRKSSTGHIYFSLIDDHATLGCIIYKFKLNKLKFIPKNGQKVIIYGHLSLYVKGGEYRISVESIQNAGTGKQFYDLELLKRKFKEMGYLDRKRQIPKIPKKILLFTSKTGAAVRDIINIVNRRAKGLEILIYPISVQGENAKNSILNALQAANQINERIDVAVISRGGGSNEDLWIFNDPDIAKALFNLKFPTISAIGHEIDITLCDYVADKRAETPSAAAEILTEKRVEITENISSLENYINILIKKLLLFKHQKLKSFSNRRNAIRLKSLLENKMIYLDGLADKIISSMQFIINRKEKNVSKVKNRLEILNPNNKISLSKQQLENLHLQINRHINIVLKNNKNKIENYSEKINENIKAIVKNKWQNIELLESKISNLSPLNILKKGYSITIDRNGKTVKNANSLRKNDYVKTIFNTGHIIAVVKKVEK